MTLVQVNAMKKIKFKKIVLDAESTDMNTVPVSRLLEYGGLVCIPMYYITIAC